MAGDESTLAPDRRRRAGSMELLLIALTALALSGSWVSGVLTDHARLAAAATVFCGVFVQALPFLVLGVIVSGLVAAYLTPERLARRLPRRPALAVAVAGVGGAALPGCECGSVPVARRLFSGETAGAALTFMLSAPAINPVVLVATAVAFPGQPQMVVARCVASLLTAVVMGLLWQRWGRTAWVTRTLPTHHGEGASRFTVFTEAARHDFLQSAAYLVVGAGAAAVLRAAVPPWVFEQVAGNLVVGVVTMALLAVVLALCSEADAFVAASLTMVPLIPRLVFLVVGPAVDVKLFAMQAGVFGRPFAVRFAPVTLVVATACATAVGLLLLGGAS
jgi:uncharacterized membrane protein YraQ (UPF0718 family)